MSKVRVGHIVSRTPAVVQESAIKAFERGLADGCMPVDSGVEYLTSRWSVEHGSPNGIVEG